MPRLRIISGEFGGRLIKAPTGRTTHPMGDRVRSALFNMIDVQDKTVLDAFAGSGAIGLEALSRGAAHVDFVDNDKQAQRIITENIKILSVQDKTRLYKMSVNTFIKMAEENNKQPQHQSVLSGDGCWAKYDIIFADPPYQIFKPNASGTVDFSTGSKLKELVKMKGLMILSYTGKCTMPTVNGVVVVDKRSYGEAALATYRRES